MNWRGMWFRLWIWLRSLWFPPSPEFDSATIDASNWALAYAPKGNDDVYATISEFSKHQYDQELSSYDSLDRKADELIRLTTTISAAILAAASTKYVAFHRPWIAELALLPILFSVLIAMRAKTPKRTITPITPGDLLTVADLDMKPTLHQMESVIAASLHVALLGMRTMTTWKAIQNKRATYAFLLAFFLLLLALV